MLGFVLYFEASWKIFSSQAYLFGTVLTWLVVNFRNARGLARVTYSGTPVGSVVDICHKNEMQCSSFQKFTSFFEHILLQNCLVALPYQPSSQQKCQEVSGLNFSLGLSIIMKTFKELLLPLRQLSSWKVVDKFGLCFMRQLRNTSSHGLCSFLKNPLEPKFYEWNHNNVICGLYISYTIFECHFIIFKYFFGILILGIVRVFCTQEQVTMACVQ